MFASRSQRNNTLPSLPALPAAPLPLPLLTRGRGAPRLAMGSNRISPTPFAPPPCRLSDHWAAFDRNVGSFAYRSRNVPPLSNLKKGEEEGKKRTSLPPHNFSFRSVKKLLRGLLLSTPACPLYPPPIDSVFPSRFDSRGHRFESRRSRNGTTEIGDWFGRRVGISCLSTPLTGPVMGQGKKEGGAPHTFHEQVARTWRKSWFLR